MKKVQAFDKASGKMVELEVSSGSSFDQAIADLEPEKYAQVKDWEKFKAGLRQEEAGARIGAMLQAGAAVHGALMQLMGAVTTSELELAKLDTHRTQLRHDERKERFKCIADCGKESMAAMLQNEMEQAKLDQEWRVTQLNVQAGAMAGIGTALEGVIRQVDVKKLVDAGLERWSHINQRSEAEKELEQKKKEVQSLGDKLKASQGEMTSVKEQMARGSQTTVIALDPSDLGDADRMAALRRSLKEAGIKEVQFTAVAPAPKQQQ